MVTKESVQLLLKKYGLSPIKHFGQNFLIDDPTLDYIADLAQKEKVKTIIEIGPGIGNLTKKLLDKNLNVTGIEKDGNLAALLKQEFKNTNLRIQEASILDLKEEKISNPYIVVGNIPYYLTGKILQKFLLSKNQPKSIILTVQKEVGERVVARAPKANFVSVMVSLLAAASIKKKIPATSFWPKPKVESVVVVLELLPRKKDVIDFIRLVRIGFDQARKTLQNNLLKSSLVDKQEIKNIFSAIGLSEKTRAHELSMEDWGNLFKEIGSKL